MHFNLGFFFSPYLFLYIAPWGSFLSEASEDGVNLATTAALHLSWSVYHYGCYKHAICGYVQYFMAHISWQGCPEEGSLGHISSVSYSLRTSIPPPLSITHIAFVVAGVAFNCWFLLVRPENSFLSRVDGGEERPLGRWDFNNDLREVSSQDLLSLWRIGPQHKGQSWQWEAANREIFIKVLTPPLRRAGSLLEEPQTWRPPSWHAGPIFFFFSRFWALV